MGLKKLPTMLRSQPARKPSASTSKRLTRAAWIRAVSHVTVHCTAAYDTRTRKSMAMKADARRDNIGQRAFLRFPVSLFTR